MFVNKSWRNKCIHSKALLEILWNSQKKILVIEPILPTLKPADMQFFHKRAWISTWVLGIFKAVIL